MCVIQCEGVHVMSAMQCEVRQAMCVIQCEGVHVMSAMQCEVRQATCVPFSARVACHECHAV